MRKIIFGLTLITSLSANAASLSITKTCFNEFQKNPGLQAQFRTIELNVGEFLKDSSKGYSRQTGNLLLKSACAPFEAAEAGEVFNLCDSIESNVKAYQKDSSTGYSLETAIILDNMAASKCLIGE